MRPLKKFNFCYKNLNLKKEPKIFGKILIRFFGVSPILLKEKKSFRLRSKQLFLTYSKVSVNLTKELVLEQLQKKLQNIKNYMIARELHEDGSPHFHVLLVLKKTRCDIKNARYLDLIDPEGLVVHGKYEAAASVEDSILYLSKGQDFIENFGVIVFEGRFITPEEFALHESKRVGVTQALADYAVKYPQKAVKQLSSLKRTLSTLKEINDAVFEEKFTSEIKYKEIDFSDLEQKEELEAWTKKEHKETLVLTGISGSGKTLWARSFLESLGLCTLYCTDFEGLKHLNPDKHKAWIMDDANLAKIKKLSTEDLTNLFDNSKEVDMRLLNQSFRRPAGMIQIIITNALRAVLKKPQRRILRRVRIVNFEKPIKFINVNIHNHYYNDTQRELRNREIWDKQALLSEQELLEEGNTIDPLDEGIRTR